MPDRAYELASNAPEPEPTESATPSPTGPPPSPTQSPTPAPTTAPPGDCHVSIASDVWQDGFVAHYTVTNNGPAWNSWTLTFTVSAGAQHVHGWNGLWSQQGDEVTVTNESWNGSVGSGASVSPGHQGTHPGSVSFTGFTVNGATCTVG